jgi:hypothetical protein
MSNAPNEYRYVTRTLKERKLLTQLRGVEGGFLGSDPRLELPLKIQQI